MFNRADNSIDKMFKVDKFPVTADKIQNHAGCNNRNSNPEKLNDTSFFSFL